MGFANTKRCWVNSLAMGTWLGAMGPFLVIALVAEVGGQPPWPEDPLPLKRVVIPLARLPLELERVRQGMLLQLPRADLEARVSKALQAAETMKNPPRLVRASYTAELAGNALVQGSGLWRVINPSAQAAVCPLGDLNLALGQVKTATARDAVLGELDGKSLGLLVEKAGSQTYFFDWTLRGLASSGGLYFEMRLPPAPVAQLELKLPADRTVSMSKTVGLVSGPHQTPNPQQRLWHLHFSGRQQVEFLIRKNAEGEPSSPLLLAQVQTRQQVFPDRVLADFEFQVEVLQQGLRELVFDCDPLLQPYEITLRSVDWKGWQFQEAVAAEGARGEGRRAKGEGSEKNIPPLAVVPLAPIPSPLFPRPSPLVPRPYSQQAAEKRAEDKATGTLVVQFREPFLGTLTGLRIRCLAPVPLEGQWLSPAVRLRHGILRGETLKLMLHPGVFPDKWDPGTFRLASGGADKDGSQALNLFDLGPAFPASRRPRVFFKTQGVDLHVRQRTWWRLGPQDISLSCDLTYDVNRGSLSQLAWKLPRARKDWQVETVELEPREALRTWTTTGSLLVLDLARPLSSRTSAKVRLRLRASLPPIQPTGGQVLDFGDLEPVEPCLREGTLAISVALPYQALVTQASLPMAVPDQEGPWGTAPVSFAFPFRNQPVTGKLHLLPQQARLQARQVSEVFLAAKKSAALQTRVELEAAEGAPQVLDLLLSASAAGGWQARMENNRVVSLERLPALEVSPYLLGLGATTSVHKAALQTLLPLGQRWRLKLARPLAQRDVLTLTTALEPDGGWRLAGAKAAESVHPPPATRQLPAASRRWQVPVLTFLDAKHQEGELLVHLDDSELVEVKGRGWQETEATSNGSAQPGLPASPGVRKLYRFGRSEKWPFPSLELCSRPLAKDPASEGVCHRSELLTIVEPQGQVLHLFRFEVQNWQQRECPVLLPPGIKRVVAARVNDQYLGQVRHEETPAGIQVHVPVAANSAVQRFELLYAGQEQHGWLPWTTLTAPAPRLPVPPRTFRRLWRLPPELVPLGGKALPARAVPHDSRDREPWLAMLHRAWHGGDIILKGLPTSGMEEWTAAQRQTLWSAEAALRQKTGPEWQLGEALERLVCEHLQDQLSLVLDAEALQARGLGPTITLVPAQPGLSGERPPFWESAGLVYVPCRPAALLTSRQQLEAWQAQVGPGALAGALAGAVGEAARHGQDQSGRLRTVLNWLEEGYRAEPGEKAASFADRPDQCPSAGTDWEVLAGVNEPENLLVVRQGPFGLAGLVLAAIFLLAAWRLRLVFWPGWSLRLWLVGATGAGLAWWWLPGPLRLAVWPLLVAALVVALAWYLRRLFGGTVPQRARKSTQKVLKAGLLVPVLLWAFLASPWLSPVSPQGPDPFMVLLVEGSAEKPQMALVTPDLLKRLDELGQQSLVPRRGAVLLGAQYRGSIHGQVADFQADFEVYSFAERATLVVPLGGVDLQEGTLLAGALAYPVPLAAPQTGYSLLVPDKGFHRLSLSFTVRLSPDQQELRFSVPRLARSQLTLSLPGGYEAAQALQAAGWQQLTPARQNQQAQLQVHLGRENLVQVRWRTDQRESPQVQAEVREAYFWDLRPPGVGLSAFLQYTVTKGSLAQVAIAMPEALAVRSVEVEGLGTSTTPRLRNWRVVGKGNSRQLQIDLGTPSSGQFQVNLLLAPQLFLGADNWPLPLPLPLKVKASEGFLAYRLEGVEALDKGQNLAVTSIAPDAFVRVWRTADRRDSGIPTAAYSFRRTSPTAALILAVLPGRPQIRQEISWMVATHHADLKASLSWSTAQEPVILLEGEVPPAVTLTSVKGPDVQRWARFGSGLQIWLQNPRKETTVELAGWAPNAQKAVSGKEGLFVLPCLRWLHSRPGPVRLQLTPTPGLHLLPGRLQNLQAEPGSVASSTRTLFASPGATYDGTFRLQSQPLLPEVRQLTCLDGAEDSLTLAAHLDIRLGQNEPQTLEVRLRHWPGTEVLLEGPAGVQVRPLPWQAGDQRWTVTLAAGLPRQCALKLTARTSSPAPLPALPPRMGKDGVGASRLVPEVVVLGVAVKESWLAVVGPELQVEGGPGMETVTEVCKELSLWPGEAERIARGGTVWRSPQQPESWKLLPSRSRAAPPVRLLLAEQKAVVSDGQRWLHQGEYLLVGRGEAEVRFVLPSGAQLVAAALDDVPVLPQQPQPGHFRVLLSKRGGPRSLRLQWTFPGAVETVARPILKGPTFPGTAEVPVVGRLWIPAGHELTPPPATAELQLGTADFCLNRAQAQLQLTAYLADPGRPSKSQGGKNRMLAAQRRFSQYGRHAAYQLVLARRQLGEEAPAVAQRRKTLEELREQNRQLAQKLGLEAAGQEAEKVGLDQEPATAVLPWSLSVRGLPVTWQSTSRSPAPTWNLVLPSFQETQEAVVASKILLLLAAAVWVLSFFLRLQAWIHRFWPEQVLLLALLGHQLFGLSLLGLVLFLLGIGGRLFLWGASLRKLLLRSDQDSAAAGSSLKVST